MNATEMMVAVLIPLGFFLLVFGVIYMHKKENLAMIEKGMNPKQRYNRPAPFTNLKWGLLLIGAGAGLLLAYLFDNFILYNSHQGHGDGVPIYFALIAIGGGCGLFGSYKLEKKWMDENKEV